MTIAGKTLNTTTLCTREIKIKTVNQHRYLGSHAQQRIKDDNLELQLVYFDNGKKKTFIQE